MTLEEKRQKLQEYVGTASEEEIDDFYDSYIDEVGPTEWSDEFTAEMEERVRQIESGEVKTIPLEEVMANAKKVIQKIRDRAAIPS